MFNSLKNELKIVVENTVKEYLISKEREFYDETYRIRSHYQTKLENSLIELEKRWNQRLLEQVTKSENAMKQLEDTQKDFIQAQVFIERETRQCLNEVKQECLLQLEQIQVKNKLSFNQENEPVNQEVNNQVVQDIEPNKSNAQKVLEFIQHDGYKSLQDIGDKIGISKVAVHKILQRLESDNKVKKENDKYVLVELGHDINPNQKD